MTRWPAVAIVIGSTVLMQIHSAAFWIGIVGLTGIAWSVMLEGAALYFWWERRTARAIAASAMLIAGPFYHLSEPLAERLQEARATAALLAQVETEIHQRAESLRHYEDRSEKRTGWARRIDNTQAALDTARERQRALLADQATQPDPWRDSGAVALQAGTLLTVLLAQILAIITLRNQTATGGTRRASNSGEAIQAVETAETEYERLARAVSNQLETATGTQRAIAAAAGVRPADVSMARNHTRRAAAGQETASEAALRRLAAYLNADPLNTGGMP